MAFGRTQSQQFSPSPQSTSIFFFSSLGLSPKKGETQVVSPKCHLPSLVKSALLVHPERVVAFEGVMQDGGLGQRQVCRCHVVCQEVSG